MKKNKIKVQGILFGVVSIVFFSVISQNSMNIPSPDHDDITIRQSYIERAPILIDGNGNFTEENGVSNPEAAGDKDNPFIIKGWRLAPIGTNPYSINISNTDNFFVIKECFIQNSLSTGIFLKNVSNCVIENNTFDQCNYGIRYHYNDSDSLVNYNITVFNNTFTDNNYGIYASGSFYNNITENIFIDNLIFGILFQYSHNSTIDNNYMKTPTTATPSRGIFLVGSHNNTISKNIIIDTQVGIQLFGDPTCGNNTIYLNYLLHNIDRNGAGEETPPKSNKWDNGSIGNYWSDYQGNDIAPNDGIGDTVHDFYWQAIDRYPIVPDDTDSDGVNDIEEDYYYLTNKMDSDSDDDGYSDGVEINGGYDPLDPDSHPTEDNGGGEGIPGFDIFMIVSLIFMGSTLLIVKKKHKFT